MKSNNSVTSVNKISGYQNKTAFLIEHTKFGALELIIRDSGFCYLKHITKRTSVSPNAKKKERIKKKVIQENREVRKALMSLKI